AHAPVRAALMERANLQPGQSVLDIGPGGGVTLLDAAEAVGQTGQVTGIDIAPSFVERAAARAPENVDVRTGDASVYAFESDSFDAAISLFGVMFFNDLESAFANIRTAIKPGCKLTFACWGPPPTNPWFAISGSVATKVLGPGPAFDPDAPGPMALAEPDKINRVLSQAGWHVDVDTVDLFLTPQGSPSNVADLQFSVGGAAMRMVEADKAGRLTDDHKEAIRAGLTAEFAKCVTDGAVRVPARINFVQAVA
ncbi:MAG: methyltransferase domain-containing protein, partial [Rhizobiaceae bacterium]